MDNIPGDLVTSQDDAARTVGLCAACRHARVQRTARGSAFWRCTRAETDARFTRYPRLPVLRCPGYEDGPPSGER